jgi:hypothetical protein
MPNSSHKRSAHALPNRDCAPQSRRRPKAYQPLSDARCRELYQRAQGIEQRVIARYQSFVDGLFTDHFRDLPYEGDD